MTATKKTAVSPRHRARELALQGIYEWRLSGSSATEIGRSTGDDKSLGRYDTELYQQLLRGTIAQHEALGAQIVPYLDRPLHELSPIEFSVLLLGAYELTQQPEVPYRVVINEAVELAKTFGGSDGHKFVNGVLDKLAAQVRATEVKAK
ncbi:MAG: transcription antitermination factor NusB [Sideroxyarcus sp.]|nr:transcription antitermination factor NusB [Sideroxyarcus sp.]